MPENTTASLHPDLRPPEPADHAAILALNQAFVSVLAPLDGAGLGALLDGCVWQRVLHCGHCRRSCCGFAVVARESGVIDSDNHAWFKTRYPRFLYLDRVVLDRCLQRRGQGRRLYQALAADPVAGAVPWLTLEYNLQPPNRASQAFHAALGFECVGVREPAPGKRLAMMVKALSGADTFNFPRS